MDLNVHRAMLWLALERARKGPRSSEYFIPTTALAGRLFHPIWLGNWATDMNQASAFFDVLDSKYRDPYQRWRTDGTYEFPKGIADHKSEWVRMFDALWTKECEAIAASPEFQGLRRPEGSGFTDADAIGGYYPLDHFDVADRMAPGCPACTQRMELSDDQSEWRCRSAGHPRLAAGNEGPCTWSPVPDTYEYEGVSERLSRTVRRAVFSECLWGPLHLALQGDRSRPANLRHLGKVLHVLQDLYAHSNFTELLVLGGVDHGGGPVEGALGEP